jgi:hypothetical protein
LTDLTARHPESIEALFQLGRITQCLAGNEEQLWLIRQAGIAPLADLPPPKGDNAPSAESVEARYRASLRIQQMLCDKFPNVAQYDAGFAATQASLGSMLIRQNRAAEGIKLLHDSKAKLTRIQEQTGGHPVARDFLEHVRKELANVPGGDGD